MLKIGITGGIGSGKSIVCEIFRQLGVPIYNADYEAKLLINNNLEIKRKLTDSFGFDIYTETGILNRPLLANIIFNDKQALKTVNSIVHPAVKQHFVSWAEQNKCAPYIIKEAAILFESGSYKQLDKIITVFAGEELRIQRVLQRDAGTREAVLARISKQMSEEEKINLANYIIYNDDNQLVIPQVLKLHQLFSEKLS